MGRWRKRAAFPWRSKSLNRSDRVLFTEKAPTLLDIIDRLQSKAKLNLPMTHSEQNRSHAPTPTRTSAGAKGGRLGGHCSRRKGGYSEGSPQRPRSSTTPPQPRQRKRSRRRRKFQNIPRTITIETFIWKLYAGCNVLNLPCNQRQIEKIKIDKSSIKAGISPKVQS